MDDAYSKAQRNINEGASKSKASSKRSKTRRNKKRTEGGASTSSSSSKSRSKSKAQNSGQASAGEDTSSSRASSSPLSSSGESNNNDVTNSKAAKYVVVALHVIDITLGMALVIYGFMVHQVAQATAIAVCCGLLLSLGAVAGIIGQYCSCCSSPSKSSNNNKNNNNRGLWASAIVGLMTCLLDLVAFILVLVSWDSIVGFLGEHREELLLTEDGVRTIDGLRVLFAVLFLIFAGLEAFRFRFMWALKDKSSSSAQVAPPTSTLSKSRKSASSNCWNKFLSMIGLAKQKKIDDFVVFDVDDNTSIERSLLWSSEDGSKPEDYLEFIPEHERGLTDFAETLALPEPPKDRTDY